jgi:hypothetical protein
MARNDRPAPTRRTNAPSSKRGSAKGPRRGTSHGSGHDGPAASTRYTPRSEQLDLPSPRWVPITMIALLVIGLLVIFLHYVDLFLPGAASNWWLLGGLGFILGGIITATQYR